MKFSIFEDTKNVEIDDSLIDEYVNWVNVCTPHIIESSLLATGISPIESDEELSKQITEIFKEDIEIGKQIKPNKEILIKELLNAESQD